MKSFYLEKSEPFVVSQALRGGFSAANETLDQGGELYTTIPKGTFSVPLREVSESLGSCYAHVARFAIKSTGLSAFNSPVGIAVQRGNELGEGLDWHPDGDFHSGRLVISDRLPTLVEGRDTQPWEIVELQPDTMHSPSPNPDGLTRTRMIITRYEIGSSVSSEYDQFESYIGIGAYLDLPLPAVSGVDLSSFALNIRD